MGEVTDSERTWFYLNVSSNFRAQWEEGSDDKNWYRMSDESVYNFQLISEPIDTVASWNDILNDNVKFYWCVTYHKLEYREYIVDDLPAETPRDVLIEYMIGHWVDLQKNK